MRTCGSAINPSHSDSNGNPAYGTESAPMKAHYPAAVASIADGFSPWRSAPMAWHGTGHERHC
jgi:hypothetical protein